MRDRGSQAEKQRLEGGKGQLLRTCCQAGYHVVQQAKATARGLNGHRTARKGSDWRQVGAAVRLTTTHLACKRGIWLAPGSKPDNLV